VQTVSNTAMHGISLIAVDFFARGLHINVCTAVARVPLRYLGFIVILLPISHKLHMEITRKPS